MVLVIMLALAVLVTEPLATEVLMVGEMEGQEEI
jgi:hypothetical protein